MSISMMVVMVMMMRMMSMIIYAFGPYLDRLNNAQ